MNYKIAFKVFASISISCFVASCHSNSAESSTSRNLREIKSPAATGTFSPRATSRPDGSVILSWLEPQGDTLAALRFSVWRNEAWSEPTTIAAAQPFSRHPSESPGVVALSDRNLIAYWSQKPPNEKIPTSEVDVYFSVSTDRGGHWTAPTLANVAGTGEESSYPSAAPLDDKRAALIWLDGANWTKQKRVALVSRTVQTDGSATGATVIDTDTCTCCPTSLVQTGSGLLAAYRGHTPENIRDISLLRNSRGRWSQPYVAHADNWHFAGCPVNGPHLDAHRKRTVIAWFTGAQDRPAVNLAFSNDDGANFSPPTRVDEGNATGRVQVVLLPGHSAVAFWLEHGSGASHLLMRSVHDDGMMETPIEVSRGSDLGYPHAVRAADAVFITWAEGDPLRRIHVALFPFAAREEEQ
jgi:hypothetical protein